MRCDSRLCMLRRIDYVTPVEHSGHAVLKAIGDPCASKRIYVGGLECGPEFAPLRGDDVCNYGVHAATADAGVPKVSVPVDQPGHNDHAPGVNGFAFAQIQRLSNGGNLGVLDEHITPA